MFENIVGQAAAPSLDFFSLIHLQVLWNGAVIAAAELPFAE